MDYDHFGHWFSAGPLRMDEDAHAWFSVIKLDLDRETFPVHRTGPVIGRDGNQMRILKERDECSQDTILRDSRRNGRRPKKRADKEAALMDTRRCWDN